MPKCSVCCRDPIWKSCDGFLSIYTDVIHKTELRNMWLHCIAFGNIKSSIYKKPWMHCHYQFRCVVHFRYEESNQTAQSPWKTVRVYQCTCIYRRWWRRVCEYQCFDSRLDLENNRRIHGFPKRKNVATWRRIPTNATTIERRRAHARNDHLRFTLHSVSLLDLWVGEGGGEALHDTVHSGNWPHSD